VGQLQRQGDKVLKPGALKSMEAVLDDLKDKNWRSTMDDAKAKVIHYQQL
jgi:E3 ubiquitin-protein ligase SHPRH